MADGRYVKLKSVQHAKLQTPLRKHVARGSWAASSGDLVTGWIGLHLQQYLSQLILRLYPPLLRLAPKNLPRFHRLSPTGKNNSINNSKGNSGIMSSDLRSHGSGHHSRSVMDDGTMATFFYNSSKLSITMALEKQAIVVGIDDREHIEYALKWTLDHFFTNFVSNPPFKLVVHAKPSPPFPMSQ
ncbi:hypothetical protein LWI28_012330 [Acer negundo]|uniref:Uncharacterized protein n=1 Tax=Acer negundo TaxID=4023 RepID=A0AAD5JTI0_ACENE|nr:hypothetical protein LWI28_012330 [Acer negundo]